MTIFQFLAVLLGFACGIDFDVRSMLPFSPRKSTADVIPLNMSVWSSNLQLAFPVVTFVLQCPLGPIGCRDRTLRTYVRFEYLDGIQPFSDRTVFGPSGNTLSFLIENRQELEQEVRVICAVVCVNSLELIATGSVLVKIQGSPAQRISLENLSGNREFLLPMTAPSTEAFDDLNAKLQKFLSDPSNIMVMYCPSPPLFIHLLQNVTARFRIYLWNGDVDHRGEWLPSCSCNFTPDFER